MASRETETSPRFGKESDERAPERPTALGRRSWGGVLKRTFKEFKADNLTDWAAALTYYGVLSIFPALLVLVSILGLIGDVGDPAAARQPRQVAPGPGAGDLHRARSTNLQAARARPASLFIVGLARRAVVGVGLRRRVHARVERDLRGRARAGRSGKLRPMQVVITLVLLRAARRQRRRGRRHRAGSRSRSATCIGVGRHRGDGLGHRQVAGARCWS